MLYYLFPGIGLELLRVPVRIHSSDSSQCLKPQRNQQGNSPLLLPEDHDSTDAAEASASDHERDPDVSFHPVASPHNIPTMFMPYIEGPKMNWTVDDGLYHRFLKWHLKCEMILDCKLANLPTKQKCQKVIMWSRDFGMDLYVSWNIPKDRPHIRCNMDQI